MLLHSLSTRLSDRELTELKFLCRNRVSKRKLELMESGLDLFNVLLEQNDLDAERTDLLRQLLTSLRRQDLLQCLDSFEVEATAGASLRETDLRTAFDIICDNVGRDWKRLARQLNISDTKIDAIEERYPRNLPERVRESLRIWGNLQKENATVARLVQVLRDCRMNLVADLVEEEQQARESQNESKSMSSMAWESEASSSQ